MSAQPGQNIQLNYGPQPAQAQHGNALLLDYAPAPGVRRLLRSTTSAPWLLSAASRSPKASPFSVTRQADPPMQSPWAIPAASRSPQQARWHITTPTDTVRQAPWSQYERRPITESVGTWHITTPVDTQRASPWGRYEATREATATAQWGKPLFADRAAVAPWGTYGRVQKITRVRVIGAQTADQLSGIPWGRFRRPLAPGWGIVTPPDDTPVDENGTVLVPVRSYYIVINQFSLVRLDTGQAIPCEDFRLQLDADSYTWGWSATLHANQLPNVRPSAPGEHVELLATLNGTPIRIVVERLARDRRFADARLRISGRGRAAWLSDPHSPTTTHTNATEQTAQQILDAALSVNGVSLGWTLDWRVEDWLIPAGAYSHTGSYIDHATRIAQAAGAIVQPHDTAQTLVIQSRYPQTPWNWSALTPDIQIPEDVAEVEGLEWIDRPHYTAVWVGDGHRLDKIKRTGTAGAHHAPSIIDPLATTTTATRQRGIPAISDTGRQAIITLRMPVLPETGLIRPGQLVRYTEQGNTHLGLSRSLQVDVTWPEMWQTIKVETHDIEPV